MPKNVPLTERIVAKYSFGAKSANRLWMLGKPIPKPMPKIVAGINKNQVLGIKGTRNRAKAYRIKDALIKVVG